MLLKTSTLPVVYILLYQRVLVSSSPPPRGMQMRRTQSTPASGHPALGGYAIQRSTSRVFIHLSAWLTVHSSQSEEHVAFVRDISPRGIFFYSDFKSAGTKTEFFCDADRVNSANQGPGDAHWIE